MDFNHKDVGSDILKGYFRFSPNYRTGTYFDEAGAERERFYEYCMMPCSFSYVSPVTLENISHSHLCNALHLLRLKHPFCFENVSHKSS